MVHNERIVYIRYASWLCDLRRVKDPDLEKKHELVKVILNRLGYEGGEKFDTVYEDMYRFEDERRAKGNYLEPCYD